MNDDGKPAKDKSSAENVEQHLLGLKDEHGSEQLFYSQDQPFSSEELARLINETRLNTLLAQSDEFLRHLDSEIKGFDEDDL